MSRRNRRQQEELEALQNSAGLAAPQVDDRFDDDEDADVREVDMPQSSSSKFAALLGGEQSDDDEDVVDETVASQTAKSKKKRNKKKKPKAVANDDDAVNTSILAPQATSSLSSMPSKTESKKKKGKQRANAVKSEEDVDDGLDEIDRALQQLGAHDSSGQQGQQGNSASQGTPATSSRIRSLLSVETNQLDADAELKRFFGAKVVASAEVKPQVRGARAQNPHHALHRQFARGGILAKPKPTWPPAAFSKSGLSMELVEALPGETLWTFEHSRGYKEVTHMYLEAVSSMDPNQMMALLHVHPYHVETLLGLSDMAAQQGDPGMSQDFLDRALYAFEKAFAPNFSIQNGNVRLDFSRIESRGFFRALEKRINSMSRRGTWRTLFEHSKLLYSLSPFDDPYGALLFLDFTAPKAKQYSWLVEFLQELPSTLASASHDGASHLQVDNYPGLHFAKALCQWHLEDDSKSDHEESTATLQQAILRYPLTCLSLLQKLQSSVPKELAALSNAQPETGFSTKASYILQLLSQLYVHRSDTLWNEPEVKQWLQQTVREVIVTFTNTSHPDVAFGLQIWRESLYPKNAVPQGILRHVLVAEIQSLRSFLPQSVLNSMSFTYDPLPPGPGFDDAYFKSIYEAGGKRTQGGRSRGVVDNAPDDSAGLVQRLLQYLQTGGAGGQALDTDTQAAVIAQLEQLVDTRGNGLLPGQLPGLDESDDDADGEEAPAREQANRGLMDFFRGMWSNNAQAQTDSGVDDDNNAEEDGEDEGDNDERTETSSERH